MTHTMRTAASSGASVSAMLPSGPLLIACRAGAAHVVKAQPGSSNTMRSAAACCSEGEHSAQTCAANDLLEGGMQVPMLDKEGRAGAVPAPANSKWSDVQDSLTNQPTSGKDIRRATSAIRCWKPVILMHEV